MRTYTPIIDAVLAKTSSNPLGPGEPNDHVRGELNALDIDSAFRPNAVIDGDMAGCCVAALWLAHNFLDQSHSLCQDIGTREGSYWHAIMHRREPDAANAGYWFRRVGDHAIFASLRKEADSLGLRLKTSRWDPFEFVELCEQHRDSGSALEMTLRRVQQREWELLFDWCFQHAIGNSG